MAGIKFIRNPKSRKRRRWQCTKKVNLYVETPDKLTVSKTRKKTRKTRDKIAKMDSNTKRKILEGQGVLKENSNAPQELVDIILKNLV
ncbi:MAG: hypothetical protein Ct9H90mP28_5270 [Paracoccaceae bacterium]|jgi:hypothetical protein|nr:MAG: hypothetical protein Ct9H90mP28_5270 [Paracoccaceae bacterium]